MLPGRLVGIGRWIHAVALLLVASAALRLSGADDGGAPARVPIVFASRTFAAGHNPAATPAAVERAERGRLMILDLSGSSTALVDASASGADPGTPVDAQDPSVSWNATHIVFSGFSSQESAWRLFEVGADGSGLRQITKSDRTLDLSRHGEAADQLAGYDDVSPCYLPDGRICFVSTRYPGIVPDGRARTTNLYVVNADGSGVHRITTERFGADTPTVDPSTGQIVYSRWWRTVQAVVSNSAGQSDTTVEQAPPPPIPPGGYYGDPPQPVADKNKVVVTNADNIGSASVLRGIEDPSFSGVNSWFLASIRPDGTGLQMYSGFRLNREETQAYRPRFLPNGDALALFIFEAPFLGFPLRTGLRSFHQGAGKPRLITGPHTFAGIDVKDPGLIFASAEPLSANWILVTASRARDATASQYDIWLQRRDGSHAEPLFGTPDAQELDAVPLVARDVPPVLDDLVPHQIDDQAPRTAEEAYARGSFKFISENIHFNGPVDMAIAGAPPVGKGLSIEFYMAPQRTRGFPADPPILLGTKEIGPDGRVEMELPAGVPLFEVLRRRDGTIGLGRDGQVYHVGGLNFGHAGHEAHCVGCHAGHTLIEPPEDRSWTNLAPSATVWASSTRDNVKPFFEPKSLVDRRTDAIISEWAAATPAKATYVQLRWSVPIRAKTLRVYGTAPGNGLIGERSQTINDFMIDTYREWQLQQHARVLETISKDGTPVDLDPEREIDALVITISGHGVHGLYEGASGPALAEVEVIAKASGASTPTAYFVRGDTNCDTVVNVSDAALLLGSLFKGTEKPCCAEAADVNGDARVDLTDPVSLLLHLFRGGPAPRGPYPGCGRGEVSALGCDSETCP